MKIGINENYNRILQTKKFNVFVELNLKSIKFFCRTCKHVNL